MAILINHVESVQKNHDSLSNHFIHGASFPEKDEISENKKLQLDATVHVY